MKRIILLLAATLSIAVSQAQSPVVGKKYQSLLWEITGNGLKKPSYLIGTMHVSSKMAFNLPDSFYIAVRSAQVVALETNPETWQEDMSKYDFGSESYDYLRSGFSGTSSMPNDYLTINTLKFYKYETKIEKSLYSSPSTINNLLYRTYGNESSDFEEDTYLDMYIFQCGKKWGKKVTGVENYGESMHLMAEAYKDAAKEKTRKDRSYGDADEEYSQDKLQEAYRSGNLDLLDSINKYNSFSAAFDEKFLYQRNINQAGSIDSILKSGSSLFVGVGAAHLPGDRGVIEILRKKGYKLRPVKMGERASKEKDLVDKIRVPVTFKTETADDGLFKVDIPGKFYKFGENAALDQKQYADMANGSYYMVTRVMTNAWMWNQGPDDVYKKIDSLLYENIPGKILSRADITRNGYRGLDVTNRTRRGDVQRYNIFITPFEIIFFKMSGNADYVKEGEEAKKFFGSIQFKEYKNPADAAWKKYSPPYGGFAVDLPHDPYIGNDGSWIYDATDKQTGNSYRIIRSDINNLSFVEEDTFDLSLMDESFKASEFIDTQLLRKQITFKGYPAMDCRYRDKKGYIYATRFIIQGPHYYTLVAHGKQESPAMNNFLNSFELKPYNYGEVKLQKDTSLYFSVNTPWYPESKKIKLDMPQYSRYGSNDDEDESESSQMEEGLSRNRVIANDSTGEKIYVVFYRSPRYYYNSDSSRLDKNKSVTYMGDSNWIVRLRNRTELPSKTRVFETIITDTGSSRTIWSKTFYKNGITFNLLSQSDTLSKPSEFVKKFYETFDPVDTLKGTNPFVKKSGLFFSDLNSKDSVLHKRAVKYISQIELDSTDLPQLKNSIAAINWNEKNYLDTKSSLINKLSDIKTNAAALYLKDLYYSLDDTVQLQYPVLESLLQQKTQFAFNTFRGIVSNEPPVLDNSSSYYSAYRTNRYFATEDDEEEYDDGRFMDELFDSLQLTKTILPDLLPLLNLQDYKTTMMKLLGRMVDSNQVKPGDYEMYFTKFLIEAKQELKKQSIAEKKKAIEKAEESKKDKNAVSVYDEVEDKDEGNDDLSLYAKLLLPFWETNTSVQPLIQQMLRSNDKRLKYNTMLLLMDKSKPYPDSLLHYFAAMDEYRYELYTDLKNSNKLDKFPALYNNHLDLGRSSLLDTKSSGKPDSLVYVDRLHTTYKGKDGYIYFFKYKAKKDDLSWKLASVGLVPENPKEFEFEKDEPVNYSPYLYSLYGFKGISSFNFTEFKDVKIKETESLASQLQKELKKMIYSRRKSARQFYEDDGDRTSMRPGIID